MKPITKIIVATLVLLISMTELSFAQRGHGRGGGGGRGHRRGGVVVVRSTYRPARRVRAYYPVWRPAYAYHRRWVYFPRYNFYWDNWRQGYYYRNGPVWVFNAAPPAAVINVNLQAEQNYELNKNDDDVDDIYKSNDSHQTQYTTPAK